MTDHERRKPAAFRLDDPAVTVSASAEDRRQSSAGIRVLPEDSAPEQVDVHPIKTQTGIAVAIVYNMNESLHLDLDYLRGQFRWYGGAKQDMNYLNAGATLTW